MLRWPADLYACEWLQLPWGDSSCCGSPALLGCIVWRHDCCLRLQVLLRPWVNKSTVRNDGFFKHWSKLQGLVVTTISWSASIAAFRTVIGTRVDVLYPILWQTLLHHRMQPNAHPIVPCSITRSRRMPKIETCLSLSLYYLMIGYHLLHFCVHSYFFSWERLAHWTQTGGIGTSKKHRLSLKNPSVIK